VIATGIIGSWSGDAVDRGIKAWRLGSSGYDGNGDKMNEAKFNLQILG